MKYQEIISENGGKIIKQSSDIFTKHSLECNQGHAFELYTNDILDGQWCQQCEKRSISKILDQLNVPYQYKENKYIIEQGKTKIMILINPSQEKIKETDHNLIVINDELKVDRKNLWDALKGENKITYIPNVDNYINNCTIVEKIYQCGDSEICSITKEAPKPYPKNYNYAVGYIRVSTKEQVKDGFSLESQERNLIKEAKKYDLFLRKIYIDKGISGANVDKRAAFNLMRKELQNEEWVLSCYFSRIARNTKDFLTILDEIKQKDCHLVIREINLDYNSSHGYMVSTMMASYAQFERDQVSEKVKEIIAHMKATGQFRTKPSYGWKMNPDRSLEAPIHIRVPKELKIINEIRIMKGENPDMKITAFTRLLNEKGISPPRKSKQWYHKYVSDIMKREGIKFS